MKILFLFVLVLGNSTFSQSFNKDHIVDTDVGFVRIQQSGDFDNDDDQDLLSVSATLVAWYENLDGLGNYGDPITIDIDMGQSFNQLVVDLDKDGKEDILISYFDQDLIVWYQNLGGGTFAPFVVLASGLSQASGIAAGDLDGDNDLDLVLGVSNNSGLYWIEHLDGNGSFGPLIPISNTLSQARRQVVADIDGDNDLDVLSNSAGSSIMSWFENTDGQGDFSIQHIVAVGGLYENYFHMSDLDGDSDLDILSNKVNEILWRENLGGGNFGPAQIIFSYTDPTPDLASVYAVDLDNDGDLDVTYDSGYDFGKVFHLNTDGQGNFGPANILTSPDGGTSGNNLPVDIDGDGDMDLINTSLFFEMNNRNDIYWYENLTILSITDIEINDLILSPNPVDEILSITSKDDLQNAIFYQVIGQSILVTKQNFDKIDVSFLPKGIYLVEVQTNNGKTIKKIIKD
ncbi:putative secreted protein (Por secretion system target) [Ulvibacter sp. MAR_2010_11]|uniref:FG-GAP-like repeat-containing protein n=1 Tax=Ulvibacter sp. MAR_2010_11 TaxID=1250229 RepID=UPI000C2C29A7|nr:FG-GAP-like repeat-containing protein [Ulvibacter sp. MAR_2010_11]PKA84237.1 putative secreted protein (Por secretion system target) [Ulvibacter sp. MAR_2010_11]